MTNMINATVEILNRPYTIRCPQHELEILKAAAALISQKMQEVRDSGKAINLERIAIIVALNIAFQFLQSDQNNNHLMTKVNQRITHLQNKLETAFNKILQTELVYSSE